MNARHPATNLSLLSFLAAGAVTLASAALGCAAGAPQGSAAGEKATAASIPRLLDKDRAAVEKVLGRPIGSGKADEAPGFVWGEYALRGAEGVRVYFDGYAEKPSEAFAGPYDVSFARGTDWRRATKTLGLDQAKVGGKVLKGPRAIVEITGHGLKGWTLTFFADGSKDPQGKLHNPNRGLPLVRIETKFSN